MVNRIWQRLLGHGIVANPDEMDGKPWSPALLDSVASDFVEHGYDLKHLIQTILTSRAYQMPAVSRRAEVRRAATCSRDRRCVDSRPSSSPTRSDRSPASGACISHASRVAAVDAAVHQCRTPRRSALYAREWRAASSNLTRALGRPIRDQVTSSRPTQSTTPQALELVNGEMLTRWLSRGARRMVGELPPEP